MGCLKTPDTFTGAVWYCPIQTQGTHRYLSPDLDHTACDDTKLALFDTIPIPLDTAWHCLTGIAWHRLILPN